MKARKAHVFLSLAALVFAGACLDVTTADPATSTIRVINASGQTLNLVVDDQLSVAGSEQSNVSLVLLGAGQHTLIYRTAAGVETPIEITTPPGGASTSYAYTNEAGAVVAVLLDTIAPPPADSALVRVLNLSKLAGSVDVYGARPADAPGTSFGSPFEFLTKSNYLEKSAGQWRVFTTAVGTMDTLQSVLFTMPSQARSTVLLIDSLGVPVLRVLPE